MQIVYCSLLLAFGYCCTIRGYYPQTPRNFADEGFPSASEVEAWWLLTFEQPYLIDEIRLWKAEGYASNLQMASVYVDNVLVDIVQDASRNPVVVYLKTLYVVGSSLKIVSAHFPLMLAEVELFGDHICPTMNMAPEGTATQVDTYGGYAVASRAIDGDTNGDFFDPSAAESSVSHTGTSGQNRWWKLKFDEARWICGVMLYNRKDCCEDRLDGATVFVGDIPIGEVEYQPGADYEFFNITEFSNTVKITNWGYIHLAEVKVFAC